MKDDDDDECPQRAWWRRRWRVFAKRLVMTMMTSIRKEVRSGTDVCFDVWKTKASLMCSKWAKSLEGNTVEWDIISKYRLDRTMPNGYCSQRHCSHFWLYRHHFAKCDEPGHSELHFDIPVSIPHFHMNNLCGWKPRCWSPHAFSGNEVNPRKNSSEKKLEKKKRKP